MPYPSYRGSVINNDIADITFGIDSALISPVNIIRSDKFAFEILLTSFSLNLLCLFSTLPIINATIFGFLGSIFNID